MAESHSHSKDTGTDPSVVRYLITDNGAFGSIHDEPDVIVVNKGLDANGGGFTVVGNLLVRDGNVV